MFVCPTKYYLWRHNRLPFYVNPALICTASTPGCKSPKVPQVQSCQTNLRAPVEGFVLLSSQMDLKLMSCLLLYCDQLKQENGCNIFDGWEELESLLLCFIWSLNMMMPNCSVIIAHERCLTNMQRFLFGHWGMICLCSGFFFSISAYDV